MKTMQQPLYTRTDGLASLTSPTDIRKLGFEELASLATELREIIIQTVSRTGGHLAPSLGVVELTLALLKSFHADQDRFIWDVGHQAYAYKLLTGRLDRFHTLRQLGGISGFPRCDESPYDCFGVGHSSTSISAGLGMVVARDLNRLRHHVVSIIGDGSMTAGLAYEGLNQAGGLEKNFIVVLNDNEMSISKNVGALSSFLSKRFASRWVMRLKKETEAWINQIPKIGTELVGYLKRGEDSFKGFFTPGMLFEAFDFTYVGPINGHDIRELVSVFNRVKQLEGPILVHVLTKKGKGYEPAEKNPTHFHGVGCFEPETGKAKKFAACSLPSYTDIFGKTLCELAAKDDKIVAITAAMPEGTGLTHFARTFPDRFFDVGICEQHAVTFAAGLAAQGFKPVVAIYSTFLQRAYDQIVHDVCLQNLNVTLCLDRGGLVGEDGATHHGVFDFAYLRHIPNMSIMAPKDEAELATLLRTAIAHPGPAALRYPRGVGTGAVPDRNGVSIPLGQGELIKDGTDGCVIAVGSRVHPALEAIQELEAEHKCSFALYNLRFVKPLPQKDLVDLAGRFASFVLVEEGTLAGGMSSAVLECWTDHGVLNGQAIKRLGIPDVFVEHGAQKDLRRLVGIGKQGIRKACLAMTAG
ncbi:1-deoxy-D-xylulose-5-phosphate synthase [Desulfoplanes formicivorans]|uniref:1-deoxy-D-xylulose-5-phosphate synthase n=1 Tax=Desulfoplanes formicivorans TaxID=1592317 RepID=UPI000A82B023